MSSFYQAEIRSNFAKRNLREQAAPQQKASSLRSVCTVLAPSKHLK